MSFLLAILWQQPKKKKKKKTNARLKYPAQDIHIPLPCLQKDFMVKSLILVRVC